MKLSRAICTFKPEASSTWRKPVPGRRVHPPTVSTLISKRYYKKKINPFPGANSPRVCSDCLAWTSWSSWVRQNLCIEKNTFPYKTRRTANKRRKKLVRRQEGDPPRWLSLLAKPTCFVRKCIQSWFVQVSSGRLVTLFFGTTFLLLNVTFEMEMDYRTVSLYHVRILNELLAPRRNVSK